MFLFKKPYIQINIICIVLINALIIINASAEIIFNDPGRTNPDREYTDSSYQTVEGQDTEKTNEKVNIHSNIDIPVRESTQTKNLINNLKQLAEQNNEQAAVQLGVLYYEGKKTTRNYMEAYKYFRMAAEKENAHAMLALGYFMSEGLAVSRNPHTAKVYLEKTQDLGYARASYLLSLLEKGIRAPRANIKSSQYLQEAIAKKDPVATNILANDYLVQKDFLTARLWYEKAVDSGSPAARKNLEHLSRIENLKSKAQRSIEKLKAASAKEDAEASYILAVRYHKGLDVPVDFGQALRYYRLATNQGHEAASQMLSLILSRSTAVQPINTAWMQELSQTMKTPAIATESTGSFIPETDDPLQGLVNLSPIKTNN